MSEMTLWLLMIACGVITFLIRYSFIGAQGNLRMPDWFQILLPLVPIAALTALVTPELFLAQGALSLGPENARLWAGILAIVVAAVWRNTMLTIGIGFAALLVLRATL